MQLKNAQLVSFVLPDHSTQDQLMELKEEHAPKENTAQKALLHKSIVQPVPMSQDKDQVIVNNAQQVTNALSEHPNQLNAQSLNFV